MDTPHITNNIIGGPLYIPVWKRPPGSREFLLENPAMRFSKILAVGTRWHQKTARDKQWNEKQIKFIFCALQMPMNSSNSKDWGEMMWLKREFIDPSVSFISPPYLLCLNIRFLFPKNPKNSKKKKAYFSFVMGPLQPRTPGSRRPGCQKEKVGLTEIAVTIDGESKVKFAFYVE